MSAYKELKDEKFAPRNNLETNLSTKKHNPSITETTETFPNDIRGAIAEGFRGNKWIQS